MNQQSQFIDDLIVLGTAVPEERKDGRKTVCVAAYSPAQSSFIRIYPARADSGFKRWGIYRVEVERNPQDNRRESFKLVNSRDGWESLNSAIRQVGVLPDREKRPLIERLTSPCVSVINDRRDSLGIVRVGMVADVMIAPNQKHGHRRALQIAMLPHGNQTWVKTKSDYAIEPRLTYRCSECRTAQGHDQKILEWGAYEWFRKCPQRPAQYWENLRLYESDRDIFLLVGNQANQRTSFLVISVIVLKGVPAVLTGARVGQQLALW